MNAVEALAQIPAPNTTNAPLVGRISGGRKFYLQLLAMQDALYTDALRPGTDPADRASCARAWETLEERKRIMRGRPLPSSLKPTDTKRKRAAKDSAAPIAAQTVAREANGPQSNGVNGSS